MATIGLKWFYFKHEVFEFYAEKPSFVNFSNGLIAFINFMLNLNSYKA